MKCIYCGQDSKFSERKLYPGCGKCGKVFAFEPQNDSLNITDNFFLRVIQEVSAQNKLAFTECQLWYEFNRRLAHKHNRWWRNLSFALAIVAVVSSLIWRGGWYLCLFLFGLASLFTAIVGYSTYWRRLHSPRVPLDEFRDKYFRPWIRAHGPLEKLTPAEDNKAWARDYGLKEFQAHSLSAPEPDISAYSFDRALISDSSKIAAMLVANNFHFENNCAILSIDGYPYGLTETIMTMLRRNPALTVYALHNASPAGCQLPLTLRQPEWFPDTAVTIFDLGLLPRHVQKKHWLTLQGQPATIPDAVQQRLTPEEIAWFEKGFQIELDVLRPARLMKAIYSGIGRSAQGKADSKSGEGGGGMDIIWIGDTDGGDGDGDFDTADSFG